MADNAANSILLAKRLAYAHIIVGCPLLCLGITDRIVEYAWTGSVGFGIWIGTWVSIVEVFQRLSVSVKNLIL